MLNRRKLSTVIAILLAVGMFTVASSQGSTATNLIYDKFDEQTATAIEDHTPNEDNTGIDGNRWEREIGDGQWVVKKGAATENTLVWWEDSNDYRVLIDSGASDTSTEVAVKVSDFGDQFWGVVVRYSSPTDWIMAFHDKQGGMVLGKAITADPGWHQLGVADYVMEPQKKAHKIKVVTNGENIKVYADGNLVIEANDSDHLEATRVGIFSRGVGTNEFDMFTVSQESGGGGKGGGKPAKKGPSAPEPSTAPGDDDDGDDEGKGKKGKK